MTNMKIRKIEWNKVTWYSKLLALILFVALPFIGFCLGMRYQEMIDSSEKVIQEAIQLRRSV